MSECQRQIEIESMEQFVSLFGNLDENVDILKQELGVNIFARGTELTVSGDEQAVDTAVSVVQKLLGMLTRGEPIDRSRIRYAISNWRSEGNADRIERDHARRHRHHRTAGEQVKCKTLGQTPVCGRRSRITSCTFAVGPAGTGKTYLAIAMACGGAARTRRSSASSSRVPAVEAGEKLGFLPGDLAQKVDPVPAAAVRRAARHDGSWRRISGWWSAALWRSRRLPTCAAARSTTRFIILDEAQNTTGEQMKMFLTRMGMGSRDNHNRRHNPDRPARRAQEVGLVEALEVLKSVEGIGITYLTHRDVVRHEACPGHSQGL